ncbi:hypothetical protein [Galactobacter caseinivorans]|uniref:WD40 repeat domain-containing protein n=1 Tax=Galactobacter caseinivorans TaxID=2676123 RepID=A0A496PHI1_9MICC|nr:hypothetical protein [Galactobacter caseinivorans]RKW69946.1 hypothetical protein DWQ67_10805 [Galactobacter caseinivorans]
MSISQLSQPSSSPIRGTAAQTHAGGAASRLRRLGAGTATVVLMTGLAVGTGLPAQAAAPAPASSAALAPAVTAAKTSSLDWHWANGKSVKPKTIKTSGLSKKDYVLKVQHSQGVMSGLSGVTQDGLGFGAANNDDFDWSLYTKAGTKKLAKGLPRLGEAVQDGKTLYFVADNGQVFRINEPGKNKQATKLVKIPKNARTAVIGNGRVYWEKQISVGKGLTNYEVHSASLKGGESRLEARNVSNVQITDQGVLAASVKPYKFPSGELRYTGIVKLSGGKAKPFLSLSGSAAKKGYTTETFVPFTASGHSLALPSQAGKGTTVVNLRTRQAWTVNYSKGTEGSSASASGGRVVWTASKKEHTSPQVYIADLDRGAVRTFTAPKGVDNVAVNGRGVAWTYSTNKLGSTTYAQSIWLRR